MATLTRRCTRAEAEGSNDHGTSGSTPVPFMSRRKNSQLDQDCESHVKLTDAGCLCHPQAFVGLHWSFGFSARDVAAAFDRWQKV